MATDSSSGTLPSSSRFTIDSSSSIARSKGICPISLLSFCAIVFLHYGLAFVNGNRLLERHLALFKPLHDRFEFLDRPLEGHLSNIAVVFLHHCLSHYGLAIVG